MAIIDGAVEAAARAAEEAARRAAEAAAKKAVEEAARRAAEEAATQEAQAAHDLGDALAGKSALKEADSLTKSSEQLDGYKVEGSPADLFKAEHSVAYSQLPPDQQQKLDQVVNELTDKSTQHDKLAERTFDDLGKLLDSGALKDRDVTGKTIVDHLQARLGQEPVAEIGDSLNDSQKHGVLHDLIHSVAHPEDINQGEGTYTCTTAVVQTMLAKSYPADYVGMTAGLLYDGAGRAPTGEIVKLDASELLENEIGKRTGRGIVDAVFQGSLLSYADAKFPVTGPTTGDDKALAGGRFSVSYTFGGGRFRVTGTYGGNDRGGLTSAQVGGVLDKVLGIKTQDIEVTPANKDIAFGMFTSSLNVARSDQGADQLGAKAQRALQNGIPVGVVTEEGKLHEILVTDNRDGKVVYMDPIDGKTHEMDEGEFKDKLRAVKVPAGAPGRFQAGGTGELPEVLPDQKVLYARLAGFARKGYGVLA